jgi:hypothetical protein
MPLWAYHAHTSEQPPTSSGVEVWPLPYRCGRLVFQEYWGGKMCSSTAGAVDGLGGASPWLLAGRCIFRWARSSTSSTRLPARGRRAALLGACSSACTTCGQMGTCSSARLQVGPLQEWLYTKKKIQRKKAKKSVTLQIKTGLPGAWTMDFGLAPGASRGGWELLGRTWIASFALLRLLSRMCCAFPARLALRPARALGKTGPGVQQLLSHFLNGTKNWAPSVPVH